MELMTSWEKKGMEKGQEKTKIEVAKNLLGMGMDEGFVVKATGLSPQEVEEIKKELT